MNSRLEGLRATKSAYADWDAAWRHATSRAATWYLNGIARRWTS